MPGPIAPYKPLQVVNTVAGAVSLAATGVKNSYVVPAGRIALVRYLQSKITAGTLAVVRNQVILGGVTVNMQVPGAAIDAIFTGQVWLNTGDTAQQNCTTLDAAGTADCAISVEEYTTA